MRPFLFLKTPLAYRRIVLQHYEGEWILHDCDHLPYALERINAFERDKGVRSIYAFRPKFLRYLERRKKIIEAERLCVHFDGDLEGLKHFCTKLGPFWINGHDRYNQDIETLMKLAEEFGLKMLKPVVFSDYSCKGDLVEGFLLHKREAGLFNFHLDYFWPLFVLM